MCGLGRCRSRGLSRSHRLSRSHNRLSRLRGRRSGSGCLRGFSSGNRGGFSSRSRGATTPLVEGNIIQANPPLIRVGDFAPFYACNSFNLVDFYGFASGLETDNRAVHSGSITHIYRRPGSDLASLVLRLRRSRGFGSRFRGRFSRRFSSRFNSGFGGRLSGCFSGNFRSRLVCSQLRSFDRYVDVR